MPFKWLSYINKAGRWIDKALLFLRLGCNHEAVSESYALIGPEVLIGQQSHTDVFSIATGCTKWKQLHAKLI